MSEESDSKHSLSIGANVGMDLEAALQSIGTRVADASVSPAPVAEPASTYQEPTTEHAEVQVMEPSVDPAVAEQQAAEVEKHVEQPPEEPINQEVPKSARIVALEFPLKKLSDGKGSVLPDDKITVPANRRYHGRIVVGPEHALSGLIPLQHFVQRLHVVELDFDSFWFDYKTGELGQGSLVNHMPTVRECPECGQIYQLTLFQQKELEDIQMQLVGNKRLVCRAPACVAKRTAANLKEAELQWRRVAQPQLHPDDPIVGKMYSAFCTSNPVLDEASLIPRVWGVYPADKAPTDWTPPKHDWKAQVIDSRCRQNGWTIRPFQVTKAAQHDVFQNHGKNVCRGPIVERTFTREGVIGPVVGFMRTSTITPPEQSLEKRQFGYTVRFMARRWQPQHAKRQNRRDPYRNAV